MTADDCVASLYYLDDFYPSKSSVAVNPQLVLAPMTLLSHAQPFVLLGLFFFSVGGGAATIKPDTAEASLFSITLCMYRRLSSFNKSSDCLFSAKPLVFITANASESVI